MVYVFISLLIWPMVSLPLAVAIGRVIKYRNRKD